MFSYRIGATTMNIVIINVFVIVIFVVMLNVFNKTNQGLQSPTDVPRLHVLDKSSLVLQLPTDVPRCLPLDKPSESPPPQPIDASRVFPTRPLMHFNASLRLNASFFHICIFRPMLTEDAANFSDMWWQMAKEGPAAVPAWAELEPFNISAPWACDPDDIQWLVRCAACNAAQDRNACDWAAAETRRCGAARAYIPPVHYGALPAPELERCFHDHSIITIGDCNVRSLIAFALDALDRTAPSGRRSGALPFIELGHHFLLMRETPYSDARFRASYFYYPEPPNWNVFKENAQPSLGDLFSKSLDVWRPASDLRGIDDLGRSTIVFFIGGTSHPKVDELALWLDGGCNSSLVGCLWLESSPRYNTLYKRPRVIVKSPPAYSAKYPTNAFRKRALDLGFEWINAHPTSFPIIPFAGHEPQINVLKHNFHFDTYDTSKPPGYRTSGPLTLALTNRFLEQLCGVLREPTPPPNFEPNSCKTCVGI